MEKTLLMKGVALFATLTGVYQWLGQGTSMYDIMIILLATYLVISVEGNSEKRKDSEMQVVGDDTNSGKNFFCHQVNPLKDRILRAVNPFPINPQY